MQKAALLYNPQSGGNDRKRLSKVESALAVLRKANVEVNLISSDSRREAGKLAEQAIADGCDTIFACGGDGTIHNIVQVLAKSNVALAVLPMGTANALAHDLGIPRDLAAAAQASLLAEPRRISLGYIEYVDLKGSPKARYFVITAGAGVDAHLFYKLQTGTKQRIGMAAYYAQAWHLWSTYPMTRFECACVEIESGEIRRADVTELMCVRIRTFGGVVRELVPGASLDSKDLRAVFCQTGSRMAFLAYVVRGMLGLHWRVPGIELATCARIQCGYKSQEDATRRKIYIEADGELIGTLPADITVVPDSLTVLAPPKRA